MADEILKRDDNRITVAGAVTDDASQFVTQFRVNPANNRLKVSATLAATTVSSHLQVDTFTTTNNQTIFTATKTVDKDMIFVVNSAVQMPGVDYTNSGSTNTLNVGVPAGLPAMWVYLY